MALPHNNYVSASEISIRSMNTMRGKMCSLIEGMDLANKDQEDAVITLLKQFSYEAQEVIAQLIDHIDEGDHKFRYSNHLLDVK